MVMGDLNLIYLGRWLQIADSLLLGIVLTLMFCLPTGSVPPSTKGARRLLEDLQLHLHRLPGRPHRPLPTGLQRREEPLRSIWVGVFPVIIPNLNVHSSIFLSFSLFSSVHPLWFQGPAPFFYCYYYYYYWSSVYGRPTGYRHCSSRLIFNNAKRGLKICFKLVDVLCLGKKKSMRNCSRRQVAALQEVK